MLVAPSPNSQYQSLAPADPRPVFHLGRIADGRGQTEVAISRFQKALELDPAFTPAAQRLADQLRKSGKHDEAARIIAEALRTTPENTSLRLDLAHIRLMQGNWEAAAGDFRLCAEKVTDDPMIHYFLSSALYFWKSSSSRKTFSRLFPLDVM